MYPRARRRLFEKEERVVSDIPPTWPGQAFPEPVKPDKVSEGSPTSLVSSQMPILEIQGVYIISVAARILEMHPQTLRKYERLGLISPERTVGMLRLYSREDIRKIFLIRHLMDNLGLNLAGVEFALNVVDNLSDLERRLMLAFKNTNLQKTIEKEIDRLYHRLNLSV
ncbi:MAG: MerR family transcriptional regulator [Chloroflexota bacterium]|nr:MerR family transcriptional regulator [Chloroflexota bacterium]